MKALASELTMAEQRERQRLAIVLHDGPAADSGGITNAPWQNWSIPRMRRLRGGQQKSVNWLGRFHRNLPFVNRRIESADSARGRALSQGLEWLARWMKGQAWAEFEFRGTEKRG